MFYLGLCLRFFLTCWDRFTFSFSLIGAVIFCLRGLYTKKLEGDCFLSADLKVKCLSLC